MDDRDFYIPPPIAGRKGRWFRFDQNDQSFRFWIDERPDAIQDIIVRTGNFYEADALQLIREVLPRTARIVDVGANIGNHAVYFDRVCKADKVFVIEPNAGVIEDLFANTDANNCQAVDRSLTGFAVGAETGTGTLFISASDDAIRNRGGVTVAPVVNSGAQTVPIRRLDDLDLGDIDFIKIDVEGNALDVLTGAAALIKRCRPLIFVEIDVPGLPAFTAWVNENAYNFSAAFEHHPGILNFLLVARDVPAADVSVSDNVRTARGVVEATGVRWSGLQAEKRRADRSEETLAIAIAAMRNSDARAAQADARAAQAEAAAAQAHASMAQADARAAQAEARAAQAEAAAAQAHASMAQAEAAAAQADARAAQAEARAAQAEAAAAQADIEAVASEDAARSAQSAVKQAEARAERADTRALASEKAARFAHDAAARAETRAAHAESSLAQAEGGVRAVEQKFHNMVLEYTTLEQRLSGTQKENLYLKEIADIGRQAARTYSENSGRPLRTIRRIINLKLIKRGMKLHIVSREGNLGDWFSRHRPDRFAILMNERDSSREEPPHHQLAPESAPSVATAPRVPAAKDPALRLVGPSKRVVFVDSSFPDPSRDSGSVDTINYVTWLVSLGYEVHFLSTSCIFDEQAEIPVVSAGAQILRLLNEQAIFEFLARDGRTFELFFLSRVYCGGRFFEACKRSNPGAAIIFNTVDLHHVREEREAKMRQDRKALWRAELIREREFYISRQSDVVIVVSSLEEEIIKAAVPGAPVVVMPLFRKVSAKVAGFEHRRGIGFVGGFAHAPNVDAIRYFLDEVWPRIYRFDSELRFEIAGPGLPDDVSRSLPAGASYKGHLADLEEWLRTLRLTVAPLRYGAGAKGKVASSIVNGVPVVGTKVAFEGMGLGPDATIVADTPDSMAREIIQLHSDQAAWEALSKRALAFGTTNLSLEAGQKRFSELLARLPTRVAAAAARPTPV